MMGKLSLQIPVADPILEAERDRRSDATRR